MKYFLIASLLLSSNAFAQGYQTKETPFNKFVNKPSITWAAYSADTVTFSDPSLSDILISKVKDHSIKIADAPDAGMDNEMKIRYKSKQGMDSLFAENEIKIYGENGDDPLQTVKTENRLQQELNAAPVALSQIFYVEKDMLHSYISYAAPCRLFVTGAGDTLGFIRVFATAFSRNYNASFPKRNKIIYLTQTRRIILPDSVKQADKLKEVFGKNILQSIWPAVVSEKSKLFLFDSTKKITATEFISGSWTGKSTDVPVYDSNGEITYIKKVFPEINAGYFPKIEITQTWFYNETKNIVFNKIPEITLFANFAEGSGNTELKLAVKIVF